MTLLLPPGRFEFQLRVGYEVSKKEVIVEDGKPQSVSLEIAVPKAK